MKFALLALFTLLAVAYARNVGVDLENLTAYDYLAKIGLPLAEEIRKAEEEKKFSRIVDGTAVAAGQIPYQAGLLAQFGLGQSICGGALVRANRVLTAGHCWFDGRNQVTSFTVVLGSTTLFSGGTRINTNNVVVHNQWNPRLIRNDIAVIKLPINVGLSNTIAPIALPSGSQLNENFAGSNAVASGFGRTGDSGSGDITIAQSLRQVTLPVITNAVCWSAFSNVVDSNICTSGAGGRSTCSGDSGGPLTVIRNGRPILIGLTSFGSYYGCQQGLPGAFVRITSFMSWINSNM